MIGRRLIQSQIEKTTKGSKKHNINARAVRWKNGKIAYRKLSCTSLTFSFNCLYSHFILRQIKIRNINSVLVYHALSDSLH